MRKKKPFGNTVKNVWTIWWTKKQCLDRRQNHFESEKNHWNFHFVRARLSAALCGCDWWDSFPWQCWHRCTRVCPPLTANMFPGWSTSIYTCFWIFLASFAPPCPIPILIQKGNCGRKPLTLCLFWRVSKKLKHSNCFSRWCKPPTTKKQEEMLSIW